jgi:hypothetical protein
MPRLVVPALVAVLGLGIAVETSSAAALYWRKVITTQKTYEGCMRSALTNGLVNVRRSPDEVSGSSLDGAAYIAITCVGRGPNQRAVAFVAGVGSDLALVRRYVQETAEQVRTAGVPDY